MADKAGRLEDRPLRIKGEVFPYRDGLEINRYLTELERLGFIQRYTANGTPIIQVVNFQKHQNPHHTEKGSQLPENPNGCDVTVGSPLNNSYTPADSLIPDSLIPDSSPRVKKTMGKSPSWKTALPSEVLDSTQQIMSFWPKRPAVQPSSMQPVPISSGPELASRLSEIMSLGGDLGVCVAIARRSVEEYKQGKWIKAVQSFFGKSEDAPWKSYYQAHITNQEVSNASND